MRIQDDTWRSHAHGNILPNLDPETRLSVVDFLVESGTLFDLEVLPLLTDHHVAEARRLIVSNPRQEAAAYLLGELAPYLTADELTESVQDMLAGLDHEEGDGFIREDLIEELASCGNADHLLLALELVRRLDIDLGAGMKVGRTTLRRIREFQGRNQEIELVRRALEGTSRSQFFELLPDVLPIVHDRGGDGAMAMIVDAVITIVDW